MKKSWRTSTRRISPWMLIWVVIIIAAGVLGVMQFTWISQAASSEQERQERIISQDGIRALEAAYDEIRILIPIIRTAVTSWAETLGSELESNLAFFEANTMYPGFLVGVWVLLPDKEPIYVTSSQTASGIQLPETLRLMQLPQESWDPSRIREVAYRLGWEGCLPVDFQAASTTRGLAVIEVDPQVFFQDMIPKYFSQELPEYEISIHQFSSEQDMERAVKNSNSDNELTILIPSFLSSGIRGSKESIFFFLADELMRERRLFRLQDSSLNQEFFYTSGPQYIGVVTIDLASGELLKKTSNWILSNMVLSSSIIILFMLSLATIFFLYRRTSAVRKMEQEFTASMSHELRLPITVIKAIGDNLASGVVKDEKRLVRYGQEISGKADRLNTMVEGILMYSGLQQHRKVPILSKLDAEALIQEVLLEMKMLEGWDNISFTYSVQTGEIPIFADTEGVLRIVKNLLANAYYHGIPEQEGENPSIVLKLYRKPLNTLCIIVEDNGPGIPKNRQAKVLDPFYRLKRSIDNQIPGSGLGLYIVKRTAELNNGKFILESPYKDTRGRISQGCRFIVEIFIEERNDGQ